MTGLSVGVAELFVDDLLGIALIMQKPSQGGHAVVSGAFHHRGIVWPNKNLSVRRWGIDGGVDTPPRWIRGAHFREVGLQDIVDGLLIFEIGRAHV